MTTQTLERTETIATAEMPVAFGDSFGRDGRRHTVRRPVHVVLEPRRAIAGHREIVLHLTEAEAGEIADGDLVAIPNSPGADRERSRRNLHARAFTEFHAFQVVGRGEVYNFAGNDTFSFGAGIGTDRKPGERYVPLRVVEPTIRPDPAEVSSAA